MSSISSLDNTVIGAFAGALETFINQPLLAIKNVLQEGRAIPLNPFHYYRGLGINAFMMTPITATQFGAHAACYSLLKKWTGTEPSAMGTLLSSATAGAVSALLVTPSELVIIHQQKTGKTLFRQIQSIYQTHGIRVFGRGFGMAVARESMYVGGYLGCFPVLYSYLQSSSYADKYTPGSLFLFSGVMAGIMASVCTQPFDTVKTRQQAHLYSNPAYLNAWKAFVNMYHNEGLSIFWKGGFPRGLRITLAVFILHEARVRATEFLDKIRKQ